MTNIDDPWPDGDDASRMLKELPDVDPPSTIVGTVMSTIANRARGQATPQTVFVLRGRTMARRMLWIVAAAAAVALAALRLPGYPPVDKGTEATIGAAQRYQAAPISSADVKAQDGELQAFLHSDVFRQLAADQVAQQALKNKDFQRALADASVRAALASPDVRAAIVDSARNANADARIGAAAGVRADAARNARLDAVLQSSAALRAALAAPGVAQAIASASLGAALARPDMALALSHDAAVNAVLGASGAALDAAVAPNPAANAAKHAAPNAH
ncbi:MAG TPA: hypothetical protein VKB50_29830 [Vicinamibacterales bacterium]|nr:hypothetical protein [Vicinamibacterales bacterium]